MRRVLSLTLVLGLISGILLAFQPGVNATLGKHVYHPLQAAVLSFATGLLVLTMVSIATGAFPPHFKQSLSTIPWWSWCGGAIGAVLVTTSIYCAPKTGALVWFATVVTGQTIASLALDHYGIAGYTPQPITSARLIGAAMLIGGVILTCWK
jgi:bacterial/archaeal transporter family-2 protein